MVDVKRITSAFQKFAEELKVIVRTVMESDKGINEKVNKNTLYNSNIYLDLKTSPSFGLIEFFVNDYIQFIESGRRRGAAQPPIEALRDWAYERGIPTDNGTLYCIARVIAREGIKPRPIMDDAFEQVDEYWDKWSDSMFELLTEEIDKFFSD